MLFALSLNPRFTQSNKGDELLHYAQSIPTHVTSDLVQESKAYCKIPPHEIDCESVGEDEPCVLKATDLEFIWGWGRFVEDPQTGNLVVEDGNMYRDREFKKRAFRHAAKHQDIETSAIPINCLDQVGAATINIQWEYYIGYLKVNVAKPPGYHIIHLEGKGCF